MTQLEQTIKKIGQFTYFFADMDTIFIDPLLKVIWELGHNQLPVELETILRNMHGQFDPDKESTGFDVLFHSNPLKTNYISSRIYNRGEKYLGSIIVGPFLLEEPSISMIQDVLFENKLPISLKHSITQYYLSLPLISEYRAKIIAEFLAYHTANLHTIYSYRPNIGKMEYNFRTQFSIFPDTIKEHSDQSVDVIEKRYSLQNELFSAVEHGDTEKAEKLMHEDITLIGKIPDRIPNDPLRSEKNLAFTFNTTLRIAAERGGLHPVYIHSISEKFAIQIEKTTSIQQLSDLQTTMLREYCEAVRKLSLKNYSFSIRKAIDYIRFQLEKDLSLDTISKAIHSSPYELSRKFKKETGYSLTDYINNQRIKEAVYIMDNHNLSITDIAQMVGFNDVNYFTKVFKKLKEMTPSAYRKQL